MLQFKNADVQPKVSVTKPKIELLKPENIIDVTFIGQRGKDTIQYTFKKDGVLEYSLNENSYTGKWAYDEKREMMKFTISREENGKQNGYIVDVIKSNGEYTIHRYWYVTDAYIV